MPRVHSLASMVPSLTSRIRGPASNSCVQSPGIQVCRLTVVVDWGSLKRYVTPEGGSEGSKLCYEPLRKLGGEQGVPVTPLYNADNIFYMANFTRNLPIGNYSLYYLTSKTLLFR